jgi:hypothetical protein
LFCGIGGFERDQWLGCAFMGDCWIFGQYGGGNLGDSIVFAGATASRFG